MVFRYGSVCSGIEAVSVAWQGMGFEPAWFSEIEPFPCAVLAHHYPSVPNYGDMTTLPERILSGEIEAPDILVGGTPCQAFSVSGLRNSLNDERGNLTLVFVRILNAINTIRRRYGLPDAVVLWENVPGVLSTRDNAFGCFWQLCLASPKSLSQQGADGRVLVLCVRTNAKSHGESWMPNISESPNVAEECFLSQVIETDVPPKYYLSSRAKVGILRRAEKRGKNLPHLLREALEHSRHPTPPAR